MVIRYRFAWTGVILTQFYDQDLQPLGGEISIFPFFMEGNPGVDTEIRRSAEAPEGLGFILFLAEMNPRVVGGSGDRVRFHLGFDDLHLSVDASSAGAVESFAGGTRRPERSGVPQSFSRTGTRWAETVARAQPKIRSY